MKIKRKEFLSEIKEEMELRKTVRLAINRLESKRLQEEQTLRQIIRRLITEAKTSKIKVHDTTAGNELERLFSMGSFLSDLETDYHALRTSPEQRKSFAAHILHATKSLLERDRLNRREDDEYEKEETTLKTSPEKGFDLNVVDREGATEEQKQREQTEKFVLISGMDEAGASAAERTWKRLEPGILSALQVAGKSPQDRAQFAEYLIINLTDYFNQWEKAISSIETRRSEAAPL